MHRKVFYNHDRGRDWRDRDRDRARDRDRQDYRDRNDRMRKRSRTPPNSRNERKRSHSPRKNDKDVLDDNILSEISKLPEPSELWDGQFQDPNFTAPPPPSFQPEGMAVATANYPPPSYQPPYTSGIYDDFPPIGPAPTSSLQSEIATWNQMSLPPPPSGAAPGVAPVFINNVEDQIKKEAAIESEMRHQKAALSKQREEYIKKASILKKELDTLKDQRNELRGDAKRSPSPDTKRFLKENTKLQLEIQNKLKTIYNVVDMLNGIIGEDAPPAESLEADDSTERSSKRKSRSPSNSNKFNYVYYDPEMHWCRVCNEFPPTAKDYLNHLHSPAHQKMAAAHMEAPWHTVTGVNEGFPNITSAPTKRTPIKGLQFFVPSTAWYCKLCDQFIGDLHCASAHLKSVIHSKNYTNFVEQNPHWETDWMSDRQKAFEKSRANKIKAVRELPQQYTAHTITFNKDGFHTKRKDSPTPAEEEKKKKDKKKKKRKKDSSSSSSDDSTSSDSEPMKKKKAKGKKLKETSKKFDDKSLTEWMSNIQMDRLNANDRKLLDTIKSRMKKDTIDDEKRRSSERDRDRVAFETRKRDTERRESRAREDRERERDRDRERERDRDRERREHQRGSSPPEPKKPEIRKMPFIGKMPVYKHLGKAKDEQKKEEQKKKEEEDELSKKRREEMDAEIQKKVAEFKEKIAQAQLERQAQLELPPPGVALPTHLATPAPAAQQAQPAYLPPPQPPPPATPTPTLPKDFQEALDIIFPSEIKHDFTNPGDGLLPFPPGFPFPGMPSFPHLPMMNPGMFGLDLNAPLFQPRPQLYDTHVPLVPSPKPRPPKRQQHHQQKKQQQNNKKVEVKKEIKNEPQSTVEVKKENSSTPAPKNKEELDELAMLGIDASDVGASC